MRTGARVTMPRHLYRSIWGQVIPVLTVGAIVGLWITAAVMVFR